jgi:signal peptidase I
MKPTPIVAGIFQGWMRFFILAFLLFLGARVFVVDAYSIPTSSMESTLLVGDYLLVNKLTFGSRVLGTGWSLPPVRDPTWGEVIVFFPPHDPEKHYVKRVVGLPGDTLEMRNKLLIRNGEELTEEYVQHLDSRGDAVHPGMRWQRGYLAAAGRTRRYVPSRDTWGPIVVPEGHYFVLGDNRDNSEDSRYWGFVSRENIHGRPWKVYASLAEETEDQGLLDRIRWARVARTVH